jgi:hypothetical protein
MGNSNSSNNQAAADVLARARQAAAGVQAAAAQAAAAQAAAAQAAAAQAAAAQAAAAQAAATQAAAAQVAATQAAATQAAAAQVAAAQAELEKQIREEAKAKADAEEKRLLDDIAKKKRDAEEYDRQQQLEKRQNLNNDANAGLTAPRHNIESNNGANSSTAVSSVATADSFTTLFEDDSYINLIAYNKMPYIEGLDSINNENQFIIDLLQFNEKYMRYIHRNSKTNESIGLETEITTLYNNINNKIKKIQPSYEESKIDQSILQMRQDLDTKLKELYNTKDSSNSTVYIEITMTLLATTLIYFFVKNA